MNLSTCVASYSYSIVTTFCLLLLPSLPLPSPPPLSQCHLHRGVHPFHYTNPPAKDWTEDADQRFLAAIEKGKKEGYIVKGSTIVLLSGWKPGPAHINTIRIFIVD